MKSLLFTALLLSIDSFVVCVALTPLVQSRASRWRLAWLFGMFDGLAVVVGSALSHSAIGFHVDDKLVPFLMVVFGVYSLVAALWKRLVADRRLFFALPVLMSLDNLSYGAAMHSAWSAVFIQAFALGTASLTLAILGLYLGGLVRFVDARASGVVAGGALVASGLFFSLV